jgi:hypothetical protein
MRSVHLVAALIVAGLGLSCAAHLLSVDDSPSRSAAVPVDTHTGFYDGGFETTGDISRDLAALDAQQPTGASDLDALTSLQEIATGPDDPESRREQFQVFMSDIALLFDQIVAQLGTPQPERESDYEFDENSDPRLERVSRGFFEDMKAFFGERDAQDADVDYQTKRMDGMSNRIDQQFQDVSSLLREFEEKQ